MRVRTLIHVPIIHSQVELGSLAGELRRSAEQTFGVEAWAQRLTSIESMWKDLHTKLCLAPIDWPHTRLYQDGLPVCGREREIVQELAAKGSQNHQLVATLMERGAVLMGTESPHLLMREYGRAQRLLQAAPALLPGSLSGALRQEGEEILLARDSFMARRIDSTLLEGETGILFLGLLHHVHQLLEDKLEIQPFTHHLPPGVFPWRQDTERNHHAG